MTEQSERIPPVIGLDEDIPPETGNPTGKRTEDISLSKEKDVSLEKSGFLWGQLPLDGAFF